MYDEHTRASGFGKRGPVSIAKQNGDKSRYNSSTWVDDISALSDYVLRVK